VQLEAEHSRDPHGPASTCRTRPVDELGVSSGSQTFAGSYVSLNAKGLHHRLLSGRYRTFIGI
jgi:hypothetical protein